MLAILVAWAGLAYYVVDTNAQVVYHHDLAGSVINHLLVNVRHVIGLVFLENTNSPLGIVDLGDGVLDELACSLYGDFH